MKREDEIIKSLNNTRCSKEYNIVKKSVFDGSLIDIIEVKHNMNRNNINIWRFCKFFTLAFILNVLGIGQSHALYSPVFDYPMTDDGWYADVHYNPEAKEILTTNPRWKKEGLTMDDFHYMMQKNVNALTEAEKAKLARIRNAMPKPDANTVMQKVIPKTDIERYVNEQEQIKGYVTRAADAKHLKTYDDIYWGERLDYPTSKFTQEIEECYVIRFKSPKMSSAILPTGTDYAKYDYPFTAHGFTAGSNGRLGVPEWHLKGSIKNEIDNEIWKINSNGTEQLEYIYIIKDGKRQYVKVN